MSLGRFCSLSQFELSLRVAVGSCRCIFRLLGYGRPPDLDAKESGGSGARRLICVGPRATETSRARIKDQSLCVHTLNMPALRAYRVVFCRVEACARTPGHTIAARRVWAGWLPFVLVSWHTFDFRCARAHETALKGRDWPLCTLARVSYSFDARESRTTR